MAIYRDRPKTTLVKNVKVDLVLTAGVVQVGDVKTVSPYVRTLSVGGPRGALSFITFARHIHSATRLTFNESFDRNKSDLNLVDLRDDEKKNTF